MLVGTESRSCMDCCGRMLSKHEARLSRSYRGKEGAKALLGVPWNTLRSRVGLTPVKAELRLVICYRQRVLLVAVPSLSPVQGCRSPYNRLSHFVCVFMLLCA